MNACGKFPRAGPLRAYSAHKATRLVAHRYLGLHNGPPTRCAGVRLVNCSNDWCSAVMVDRLMYCSYGWCNVVMDGECSYGG